MNDKFTPLETLALHAACSRDPAAQIALAQLKSAVFTKRDRTGHGVFTHFEVDKTIDPITEAHGRILLGSERVSLKHPKLDHGADLIVWIEKGYIDCLETYVFGVEPWPNDDEDVFEIQEWPAK
jgi:hypothetical protein